MDADSGGDDELLACEPDAVDRQERLFEGDVGRSDVHHNFSMSLRQGAERVLTHGDFCFSGGDDAGTAGGVDGDERAGFKHPRRITGTNNRRQAELSRDDSRVACAPSSVSDDSGGHLHNRLPVGVGHFCHEYLAFFELCYLPRVHNDACGARSDP